MLFPQNAGVAHPKKQCLTVLSYYLVFILLVSLHGPALACNKIGHNCESELGVANIRELPFRVAQIKQLFKKEGVYPQFLSSQTKKRLASIAKGQVLLAIASPVEAATLTKKDKNVKVISVLRTASSSFIVTKGIKELQLLKGQKVAVPDLQSRSVGYLRFVLSRHGLEQSNYTIVSLPQQPARLARLGSGKIAAAILGPRFAFEAKKRGMILFPLAPDLGTGLETIIVGRSDKLNQEAEGTVRILRALLQATSWMSDRDHRSELASIIQKEYKMPEQTASFVADMVITKLRVYSLNLSNLEGLVNTTNGWISGLKLPSIRTDYFDLSYAKKAGLLQ